MTWSDLAGAHTTWLSQLDLRAWLKNLCILFIKRMIVIFYLNFLKKIQTIAGLFSLLYFYFVGFKT